MVVQAIRLCDHGDWAMIFRTAMMTLLLAITLCFATSEANAQIIPGGQGFNTGGPFGIQRGGGNGYRIGPPRFGVQYGAGQGVRFGTPNFGVQYGGGQILRYGTPNAGVRIGGGEGVRLGTRNYGVQFGTGLGLQRGRLFQPGW